MSAPVWPRPGRCGACGAPCHAFPSGRWDHIGRNCRALTQTAWHGDDAVLALVRLARFVPDGEPLPAPKGWKAERVELARAWLRHPAGTKP